MDKLFLAVSYWTLSLDHRLAQSLEGRTSHIGITADIEEYVRLLTGTQIGLEGKRRKVTMSHCNGCKATRIENVDSILRPEELAG